MRFFLITLNEFVSEFNFAIFCQSANLILMAVHLISVSEQVFKVIRASFDSFHFNFLTPDNPRRGLRDCAVSICL